MLKSPRRSIQAIRKLYDLVYVSVPVTPTPPVGADALLLETGDYILLETGDKILLE